MKKIFIILTILVIFSIAGWLLLDRRQVQKIRIPTQSITSENSTITPTPVVSTEEIVKRKYEKLLELKRSQNDGLSQVAAVEQNMNDPKVITELNKLEEFMRKEGTTYTDVEIVTVFFNNFPSARYPLEERQDRALMAITDVWAAVSKGAISMSQAAGFLRTRPDMSDIDTVWENNIYMHMPFAKKSETTTVDSDINKLIWSLPVGEMSEPQLFQYENSQSEEGRKINVGYMFVRVNKREQKEFDSYQEFMLAN